MKDEVRIIEIEEGTKVWFILPPSSFILSGRGVVV
jgi:hypothetical protein